MLQPFTWGAQNPNKVQYTFPLAIGIINIIITADSLLADTSITWTTSVKRTLRVGPCLSLLPLFDSL